MNLEDLKYYYNKFKFGDDNFHNLMQSRIREILLISNIYDAYVLERDGRLSEQIYGEYRQLDLSTAPRITSVTSTDEIIPMLQEREFDLVIIMMRIGNISPFDLSERIKEKYPHLPILLLLNKLSYIEFIQNSGERLRYFDDIFLWRGDAKLFVAMIKSVEDKINASYDTRYGHVRVVLVIESNIGYYSLFLPIFYAESMRLTQELIESEMAEANKRLRMRARPKILMAHDYDQAIEIYEKYREYIICVVTNVNLRVEGEWSITGGVRLIREIREHNSDLPILIQSADPANKIEARKLNAEFLDKNSKKLLTDIKQFVINNLGFGDFVFRNSKGEEIERARSMYHFEKKLAVIPKESLLYHADRNHFSAWLMAHGEIKIAQSIRYILASDFLNVEELRKFLINTIAAVRKQKNRGKVVKFDQSVFTEEDKIIQLAEGSLGGKGRGLSFLNALLVTMSLDKEYQDVKIKLPKTAIIGTNEFDYFIEANKIDTEKITELTDKQIEQRFDSGDLSDDLKEKLKILLTRTNKPLAVRSSGLLEDSQSQPFAGIYKTFMLPNNHENIEQRLEQLTSAVKIVFSTPFQSKPRKYIESINNKIEEEKMAVIIQEMCGSFHNERYFFPIFSGASQSYNFYPTSSIKHEDGIAALALGLGKSVVDGERSFRYSPRHSRIDLLEPASMVENNQREYYAIDLSRKSFNLVNGEMATLEKLRLNKELLENTFRNLTSVWDYEHFTFIDGEFAKGPRVITFRNIIHFSEIPLSDILLRILDVGEIGLGVPVEIEFAVDYDLKDKKVFNPVFYILQIRPLSVTKEHTEVNIEKLEKEELVLISSNAMGNGIIKNIKNIVFVDQDKFDNRKTLKMVAEIEDINRKLKSQGSEYILIGPGRWGSSDRFLGVPVNWAQIDQARIIIETSMDEFMVEASQGSHFFHNLVAMNVGYFTVSHNKGIDFIDWDWLKSNKVITRTENFFHIKTNEEMLIKIDGRSGKAAVFKP